MQISKTRLEAFSDGVMAIIITIMVLELKTPHSSEWVDIKPLLPIFFSYVLSFAFIGIYWANHHHLVHTVHRVTPQIIWANLHFLFWLSLIPFATAWIGENNFTLIPMAVYGGLMAILGFSYYVLLKVIVSTYPPNSALLEALQKQITKGMISLVIYLISIPVAWVHTYISGALFVLVAILWMVPDRNIERSLKNTSS